MLGKYFQSVQLPNRHTSTHPGQLEPTITQYHWTKNSEVRRLWIEHCPTIEIKPLVTATSEQETLVTTKVTTILTILTG